MPSEGETKGWEQRVVYFYDPDYHIIEVGENMKAICKRFLDEEWVFAGGNPTGFAEQHVSPEAFEQ